MQLGMVITFGERVALLGEGGKGSRADECRKSAKCKHDDAEAVQMYK